MQVFLNSLKLSLIIINEATVEQDLSVFVGEGFQIKCARCERAVRYDVCRHLSLAGSKVLHRR